MDTALVGLIARQIIRHAQFSQARGQDRYNALFFAQGTYANIKDEVDNILNRLGYGAIIRK